jgi:hypothetical protein
MKFISVLLVSVISLGSAIALAKDGSERSMIAAQKFRENQERIHGKDKSEVKTSNKKADTATEQADSKATEPASKD